MYLVAQTSYLAIHIDQLDSRQMSINLLKYATIKVMVAFMINVHFEQQHIKKNFRKSVHHSNTYKKTSYNLQQLLSR